MIRKLYSIAMLLSSVVLISSCGGDIQGDKISTDVSQIVGEVKVKTKLFKADKDKSIIHWIGKKPTRKHKGTLNITDGSFEVHNDVILAGKFTLDMTSIRNTDIEDPGYRANLEKHLKSNDFFDVTSYPNAEFVITDVSPIIEPVDGSNATHIVSGNLTMKDTTNHISFDARVTMDDSALVLESDQFVVDRTSWKIMYLSGKLSDKIKDNLIKDEIGISVRVEATL